ncbi:MAG: tRNA pseudouridine(55) synthase TruB, partial [Thermodesulfovibrionales bacterium]
YKLARKGIEIERKSRLVTIYDIGVAGISLPFFDLIVSCSKGTYIRTLCDDIGRKLGPGAHLAALQRLSVGSFAIEDALTFEDLALRDPVPDGRSVFTIDTALSAMPGIYLDEEESRKVRHGQRISKNVRAQGNGHQAWKLKGPDGELIGIGSVNVGTIIVERILNLQPDSVKT